MNERQQTEQTEEQKALERERLGGPADYDEAGGTGLQGDSADTSDETSTGTRETEHDQDQERVRRER